MKTDLKVGDVKVVEVKRTGINGEGIAYYKKLAIFIDQAIPEELVEVKITNITRNFAEAELIKIQRRSSERTIPFCKYYDKCGGCNIQHMNYNYQLDQKREILVQSIRRYTELDPRRFEIFQTLGSKDVKHYRNKASLPVRYNGLNTVVGMFMPNSNKLVHINDCPIQKQQVNKIIDDVVKLLDKHNVIAYNDKDNRGMIRYLVVRYSEYEKKAQVTFIFNKISNRLENLAKDTIALDLVSSVYYDINSDIDTVGIFKDSLTKVEGNDTITEKIGDTLFNLYPNSFLQLNTSQIENLYEQVRKAAKLSGKEVVLDAYSGAGTIGIYLSKYANKIVGIDNSKESITNAQENLTLNNITNASYIEGDVTKTFSKLVREGFRPDVVIVDPPRVGLTDEFMDTLLEIKPEKIVYVSCNPSTLAKNIDILSEQYKVKYIQPFDMFPNTPQVESITLLTK